MPTALPKLSNFIHIRAIIKLIFFSDNGGRWEQFNLSKATGCSLPPSKSAPRTPRCPRLPLQRATSLFQNNSYRF